MKYSKQGMVAVYEAENREFYQVLRWSEHQRVNRPSKSKIPPLTSGNEKTFSLTEDSLNAHGGLTPGTGNREQGTGNRETTLSEPDKRVPTTRTRPTYPDAFEKWWRTYPRRKNASKKDALTQWRQATKIIDPDMLLDITAVYAKNPGVSDDRYIPHPHKWLKDRRWESIDETNTHVEAERVADGTRPEDWLTGYTPPANEIEAEVIPWQIEA